MKMPTSEFKFLMFEYFEFYMLDFIYYKVEIMFSVVSCSC